MRTLAASVQDRSATARKPRPADYGYLQCMNSADVPCCDVVATPTGDGDMDRLLKNNRAWSGRMQQTDPDFFRRLSRQQAPRYLWIGCSDSRVSANEILGLPPGEVFVHRNVANLVVHTDLNCLSAVQYAVDVLEVRHIMVVGHYGCGGVIAALEQRRIGLANHWIHHVENVRHVHARRIDALPGFEDRVNRLCEINVIEQVGHVARLPMVQAAWERGQELAVHGLVYGVHDGILRHLGATVTGQVDVIAWRKAALSGLWIRPPPVTFPIDD